MIPGLFAGVATRAPGGALSACLEKGYFRSSRPLPSRGRTDIRCLRCLPSHLPAVASRLFASSRRPPRQHKAHKAQRTAGRHFPGLFNKSPVSRCGDTELSGFGRLLTSRENQETLQLICLKRMQLD